MQCCADTAIDLAYNSRIRLRVPSKLVAVALRCVALWLRWERAGTERSEPTGKPTLLKHRTVNKDGPCDASQFFT